MSNAITKICFIGFGEAGQTFAGAWPGIRPWHASAFDIRIKDVTARDALLNDGLKCGVTMTETLAEALQGADLVLSLVTANAALDAAMAASASFPTGALYADCNSVGPHTKRAARDAIEAAGGRYADVAIMAPVNPKRLAVPLLTCGPHAEAAAGALRVIGFTPRIIAGDVGAASAIKMIRSIMVKGVEALTAECILSAYEAEVEKEVIASLNESTPGIDWAHQADYNLDRMMVHGLRRAEEMLAARETASALGMTGRMSAATAAWQARIGSLGLKPPPDGLDAKVREILKAKKNWDETP